MPNIANAKGTLLLQNLALIDDPAAAAALLDPVRSQVLEMLRSPDSATGVARKLGLPRQRLRYHVKELERHGLIEHVEDRRKGNCVERLMQATARRYLISPEAVGGLDMDPEVVRDRFSSDYLIAITGRTLQEVTRLRVGADQAGKKLPTLTLDSDVRFANPAAQGAFVEELGDMLATLIQKYHRPRAASGRSFRFIATGYPAPAKENASIEKQEDKKP
jgi:DNA-binding transcriptional ArsR family regulator